MLLLYWAGAQIGFAFSGKGILTPVWPPAGVAAAAAILFGPRSLWLAFAYIAIDFALGNPSKAPWAWVEPLGVLLSALAVRAVALRLPFDPRLGSLRAVLLLPLLALLYAVANGLLITPVYCELMASRHCADVGMLSYLGEAMIGDFFGALVCLPAVLGWFSAPVFRADVERPRWAPPRPEPGHWRFLAVALPAAAAAWAVTRSAWLPVDVVGFLVMPLLVWAALQFRPLFVHTVVMVTALVAISLQLSSGSVTFVDPRQHIVSLLVFLLSMSMLTLIVHAVAQQKQARAGEQATQIEKARIDLMLQSASEAVISFGADGRISYLNPAAARLFGERAAAGADAGALIPDARLSRLAAEGPALGPDALDRLFEGPPVELVLADAAGAERAIEIALASYRSEGAWQATAFLHDVTARRKAEQEIRASLARQEELNKLRSQFVAVTSHEFRTPMATILSSAEILMHYGERVPPAERGELLVAITRAVERMTRMIERVLFIGRTDAEMLEFAPRPLDLVPLCREIAAEALQEWSVAGVTVEQDFPAALEGAFDERLLRHALGNLLSNAIKYSQGSTRPVRFAARREDGAVVLEVEDHGIGIPPADLPHLFEPFHRAANVGSLPGTGLGLSIVRRAVETHGGRIEVQSQPGIGTRFTIRL